MKTKSKQKKKSKRSAEEIAADKRKTHIASLVHKRYGNPNFNIRNHVPDITKKEIKFFLEQYSQLLRDYHSE